MTNMKKEVMKEGFVDQMNKEVINSQTQLIADFDLETVKIEDLDFASGFDVQITKYNSFNGVIVWFDCDFSHGHEVVTLSTSKAFFLMFFKAHIQSILTGSKLFSILIMFLM